MVNSTGQTIAGVMGNVLEWYDFALFGFFSDIIADVFFPPSDDGNSDNLIKSFAVYGGGMCSFVYIDLCVLIIFIYFAQYLHNIIFIYLSCMYIIIYKLRRRLSYACVCVYAHILKNAHHNIFPSIHTHHNQYYFKPF